VVKCLLKSQGLVFFEKKPLPFVIFFSWGKRPMVVGFELFVEPFCKKILNS